MFGSSSTQRTGTRALFAAVGAAMVSDGLVCDFDAQELSLRRREQHHHDEKEKDRPEHMVMQVGLKQMGVFMG